MKKILRSKSKTSWLKELSTVHSATLTKTDVLFNIAVHLDIRIQNDRFMTFRKMISSIWNAYLRVLSKYPMGTQIVQTGKAFFPNNNYFIF